MALKAIRKNPKASDGYDGGDIDELIQMFRAAMVWDGNHSSKSSRDHLIGNGYAFRVDGQTALTGRGKIAALTCWPMPRVWWRIWRRGDLNKFDRFGDQKSATQ